MADYGGYDPVQAFDPSGGSGGVAEAARRRLERQQRQQADDQSKADSFGLGGGIVGAAISTAATGNPMLGWSIGRSLGRGIANPSLSDLPGYAQIAKMLKSKAEAESAAGNTDMPGVEGALGADASGLDAGALGATMVA